MFIKALPHAGRDTSHLLQNTAATWQAPAKRSRPAQSASTRCSCRLPSPVCESAHTDIRCHGYNVG